GRAMRAGVRPGRGPGRPSIRARRPGGSARRAFGRGWRPRRPTAGRYDHARFPPAVSQRPAMNPPPRRTERAFGVPFPGEVLPQEKWVQAALRAMPEGRLNWRELFGRVAPVVLDLGCGNGRFAIGSAVIRPNHDHLGVDVLPVVIRYARKRGNQRG